MKVQQSAAHGLLAVLACLVLAGCGLGSAKAGAEAGDDRAAGAAAPRLVDVTPLRDPRAWQGEAIAELGPQPVDAVGSTAPRLPVEVTDAQGTEVTVNDADRILALDVSGTLARTVFELGLGDNGRRPRHLHPVRRGRGPAAGHARAATT